MGNKSQNVSPVRTEAKRPQWIPSVSQTTHPLDRLHALQQALGNQGVLGRLQAKLTVNQPEDIYEQEADRMADAVMANATNSPAEAVSVSTAPVTAALQRKCTSCEEEDELVQRKE